MVAVPLVTADVESTDLAGTGLESVHDLVRRGRIGAATTALVGRDPLGSSVREVSIGAALLAECHLARGDLRAALALSDLLSGAPRPDAVAWAQHALGELASATGEPDLALERFRAAAGASGDLDLLVPWRSGAALALLRLGRRSEALALAHEQHDLARATGTPYDVALALRVLATTDPTTATSDERAPRLREALAVLDGVEASRLRAQLETDLAGLLLLDGTRDEALDLLRSAECYAAREDLWPLQSRVRRLLDRMGEAPRRDQTEALAVLTAAERRVALLALEGLSNRQIAEQLGVTVKAVESHLSKVYRKLGLRSRGALVASISPR